MKAVSRVVVAVSAGVGMALAAGCGGGAEGGDGASEGGLLSSVGGNSGEVLYGTECAEHEDKVAVSYPMLKGAPLHEGAPYRDTMDTIDRVFYREDVGLMGFGDEYVEFTSKQIADIQAGTLAIQRDYEEYYGEPISSEDLSMLQINVLNKDHEFRLKNGHVDGDMCVDAEDGNRALKK